MPRPKGARDADYAQKRATLLHKLSVRLARLDDTRPSLRQLAAAADVTVPTLRHYFGTRDDLIEAVFTEYHRLGEPYLRTSTAPEGGLAESIHSYLTSLVQVLNGGLNLGDVFAVGLMEGMLNHRLGPAFLANVTDPLLDALTVRLEAHQAKGEMIKADVRSAALILIAPVVVASNHQHELFGRRARPMDLLAFVDELTTAFVRAYAPPAGAAPAADPETAAHEG